MYIDIPHLLLGILAQSDTEASRLLIAAGFTHDVVTQLTSLSASYYFPPIKRYFPLSRGAFKVLDVAINVIAHGRQATIDDLLRGFFYIAQSA